MPTVKTLEQIRQVCLDRQSRQSDEVVSLKSLFIDPAQPRRLIVRRPGSTFEKSYPMLKRVYSQMSTVIYGLPGGYIEKLFDEEKGDAALAAANFNHWVGQNKDKEILLRFRRADRTQESESDLSEGDNVLRAMMPTSWNPIPFDKSMDQLITRFGQDQQAEIQILSENQMALAVITCDLKPDWNPADNNGHNFVDDPWKFGFRFKDSDVGHGALELCPFTMRMRCTNGAYSITDGICVKISHSGKESKDIDTVLSSMRQGVEMIGGYAQHIADQIDSARQIHLDVDPEKGFPEAASARLVRDFQLTQLQAKYIHEAWDEEAASIPEPTVYRLANAFTRAGTHANELDEDKKSRLQQVGGRILELAMLPRYTWN